MAIARWEEKTQSESLTNKEAPKLPDVLFNQEPKATPGVKNQIDREKKQSSSEKVDIQLTPGAHTASFGKRVTAGFIDSLLMGVAAFLVMFLISTISGQNKEEPLKAYALSLSISMIKRKLLPGQISLKKKIATTKLF
ncbi:MAG TPA: hypothetical protein V6C97_23635 [Oculatellaceae cyanobacterium]